MNFNHTLFVRDQLLELASTIDSHHGWWRFPTEDLVQGFLGDDPLLIVGDQPSTSSWNKSHPNRRAFYDTLLRVGVARAHLTDIYKRRGRSGELKTRIPTDFEEHLKFFRKEIEILQPKRIIALGNTAYELLLKFVPDEVREKLFRMWHFSYVVRAKRVPEYEVNMRNALTDVILSTGSSRDNSRIRGITVCNTEKSLRKLRVPLTKQGCATTYSCSRLCFKAKEIEPLEMNDKFCVITNVGTFVMTKQEFYLIFPRVVTSNSYLYGKKEYHYPRIPRRALRFQV